MNGVRSGSGATWKLRTTSLHTLLDQFGQPIAGDQQARPLLVTEGSAREKLQAIESNVYLAHALEALTELEFPLVIFGSSLSAQDQHLIDAISQHTSRPVAISMLKDRKTELLATQSDIYRRLGVEDVFFFDAATHPLGSEELVVDNVDHE